MTSKTNKINDTRPRNGPKVLMVLKKESRRFACGLKPKGQKGSKGSEGSKGRINKESLVKLGNLEKLGKSTNNIYP